MANPWREKVLAFNRKRAQADEKAQDLSSLLAALPPGIRRQLERDEVCGAILRKYGMTE